jgi:hypothetical protein
MDVTSWLVSFNVKVDLPGDLIPAEIHTALAFDCIYRHNLAWQILIGENFLQTPAVEL